jgi:hypothetical protein
METNSNDIELVISRYNEDLNWLKDPPFKNYPIICYNKGNNENFYKPPNMKIVSLENVGKCDHTYIYHVVSNYNSLSKITIFLPGSINMETKRPIAERLINEISKSQNTVFIGNFHEKGIKNNFYDFKLDEWETSDENNKKLNPEKQLELSKIRPFGKWYDYHFGDKYVEYTSYFGIIGFHKKHILQHPLSYYQKFLDEINKSSNPEVGHYFERSWAAIFGPLDGAIFIA